IAERMELLPEIDAVGYHMQELRVVNDRGQRISGFGTRVFGELTGGRYITLARSDLSRLIFDTIKDSNEVLFSNEVASLRQDGDGVDVTLADGRKRRFDLVIGADGLHSQLRTLTFGPEQQFERHLGYTVAAFEVSSYLPRDEGVYMLYGRPGRMAGRFALHDDRTLFLLIFVGDYTVPHDLNELSAQKAIVKDHFKDCGWECEAILTELDASTELYFDRVSQIKLDKWSRGRVALIGDAAFCVSLLAGQGSALAMTAAYVLAGELAKSKGDHEAAFRCYEGLLRPFMEKKQEAARTFASAFAPKTKFGLFVRNQVMKALRIPGLAKLTIGQGITDRLTLPDYFSQGQNQS
ncbi:MAG: FAD-dependent monooxygenase, partial [Terriglobales bacterium]